MALVCCWLEANGLNLPIIQVFKEDFICSSVIEFQDKIGQQYSTALKLVIKIKLAFPSS